MAFKYEELTWEQGKELQSKHGLINPASIAKDVYIPRFWAINRDEDAYIFFTGVEGHGSGPDPTYYFTLYWHGQRIEIEEYEKYDEPTNTYMRTVKSIKIPKGFLNNETRSNLEAVVKDAIVAVRRNLGKMNFEIKSLAEPIEIKQPSLI